MKRFFALLMAALMLLSALPVLAEEEVHALDVPAMGMTLIRPESYADAAYTPQIYSGKIGSHAPFVSTQLVTYYAIPNGKLNESYAQVDHDDKDALAHWYTLMTTLGTVLVTNAGSLEEALAAIDGKVTDEMAITEFDTLDTYHYYYITAKSYDEYLAGIADREDPEKVRADMQRVNEGLLEALREARKYTPVDILAAAIGTTLDYQTTDLDGNAFNTLDLFRENKITMVNFWATWCGYCVREMPELAGIHTRLREKGCGIVGIELEDGDPIDAFRDKALSIMEQSGTNYPNLLGPEEPSFLQGYPCTVFVDSAGKILTYPIIGAKVGLYESTVDRLLAGEVVTDPVEPSERASSKGEYRVIVTDGEKPVPGVAVQLCDDTTCSIDVTSEDGVAVFQPDEPKAYDVHILKVPDGYAENEALYKTEAAWSDLTIAIEKAE